MTQIRGLGLVAVLFGFMTGPAAIANDPAQPIRVGVIGVDTPHSTEFARCMNDPQATGPLARCSVVAAYLGGTPDVPASVELGAKFGKKIREMGVEIVDSIPALLERVDAVMINTLDGRPHLQEARQVIAAGKPLFIDKPLGASLAECVEIFQLAEKAGVPCFSSSSLRYAKGIAAIGTGEDPKIGKPLGCAAYGPNHLLEPHRMPDLFYYGIHGAEILFTIMGPGCKTVSRIEAGDNDLVVGVWEDGRIGTYRSHPGFGATVYGTKGVGPSGGWTGYDPLAVEIARFFVTRQPPVSHEATLEIYTFLEAADQSKRQGGCPVSLEEVLTKARQKVEAR